MTTEASEGAIHSAAARESATTLTTRSLSWRWWISLSAAVVLAALALGGGLSVYIANTAAPSMQRAGQIDNLKDRVTAEKDLLQYQADNQTKVWTAIVQALGAVVLGVGAVATWRNLRVAQENVWVAQNNLAGC